jgi:hypothetical protein
VRWQFAQADLGADWSAVFAGEFMSFTFCPFFWSFSLEEPGGRLPALLHRGADGSQSLEAGRRFGLFECAGEFVVGANSIGLAAANPIPQRLGRDAGEIAGDRAVLPKLDHGEELFLNFRREFRRTAEGVGHLRSLASGVWRRILVRRSGCDVRRRKAKDI